MKYLHLVSPTELVGQLPLIGTGTLPAVEVQQEALSDQVATDHSQCLAVFFFFLSPKANNTSEASNKTFLQGVCSLNMTPYYLPTLMCFQKTLVHILYHHLSLESNSLA